MVPVHLFLVQVAFHLLPEKDFNGRYLLAFGCDKQVVVRMQHGRPLGDNHLLSTPDARDDELQMCPLRYRGNRLAVDSRVKDDKLTDVSMVIIRSGVDDKVVRPDEEPADEDHGEDDAYHTQRIGDRRCQCRAGTADSCMLKGLLPGTERRRVRRRAAEDAHHVGHRHLHGIGECHGHHRTQQDHAQRPKIERCTLVSERAEEIGTDTQTERIDEDDQPEGLTVIQHPAVYRQAEAAYGDAEEEDEGDTQRDAAYPDFPQA